jgi:hypothetical protein
MEGRLEDGQNQRTGPCALPDGCRREAWTYGYIFAIDAIRLACTDHDGSCESDICEGSIFIVCFISSFISFYL